MCHRSFKTRAQLDRYCYSHVTDRQMCIAWSRGVIFDSHDRQRFHVEAASKFYTYRTRSPAVSFYLLFNKVLSFTAFQSPYTRPSLLILNCSVVLAIFSYWRVSRPPKYRHDPVRLTMSTIVIENCNENPIESRSPICTHHFPRILVMLILAVVLFDRAYVSNSEFNENWAVPSQ